MSIKKIVEKYIGEEKKKDIDRDAVMEAATNAAEDIFDKPDMEKIGKVVDSAIKKAKNTEDAIQIAIDMMRSD
ncbi:MAG: hypothetical protein ACOCQD_01135 [archaeon]